MKSTTGVGFRDGFKVGFVIGGGFHSGRGDFDVRALDFDISTRGMRLWLAVSVLAGLFGGIVGLFE
jgi:hypothetical protein